jgi:hypothetical protein
MIKLSRNINERITILKNIGQILGKIFWLLLEYACHDVKKYKYNFSTNKKHSTMEKFSLE